MTQFVPREKMSKKARRELDLSQRATWSVPPVTRRIENKKRQNRKNAKACIRCMDFGAGFFLS